MRPIRDVWLEKHEAAPTHVPAARLVITRKGQVQKSVAVIAQATEADVTETLWDDPAVSEIRIERGVAEVINEQGE